MAWPRLSRTLCSLFRPGSAGSAPAARGKYPFGRCEALGYPWPQRGLCPRVPTPEPSPTAIPLARCRNLEDEPEPKAAAPSHRPAQRRGPPSPGPGRARPSVPPAPLRLDAAPVAPRPACRPAGPRRVLTVAMRNSARAARSVSRAARGGAGRGPG